MHISKEHKLSIKISFVLFFVGLIFIYFLPYILHSPFININYIKWWNKYFIFFILIILSYFVSYILAKITIKPIEENNQKLREYNHNLAHEIKTPLSVVKSNLELLEYWFDKNLIISSKEEIIHMQEIIDSLLFLSEKSDLEYTQKNNLNIIIKSLLEDCIIYNESWNFIVNWNEVLLKRVISNLIDNAKKYRKKDTKIIINITKNSFEIINEIDRDFEEKDINKLFELFYQSDNSRYWNWYWLGLSIVKKISKLHNLDISLKTKNKKFIFEIKK